MLVQASQRCASHCQGLSDGTYQSCDVCHSYITCSGGAMRTVPCPPGLIWDNTRQSCGFHSDTCLGNSGCVTSCQNLPEGNYPSCDTCIGYVSCHLGQIRYVGCPVNKFWDDQGKACIEDPSICESRAAPGNIGSDVHSNLASCVSSCAGILNGDYQSCEGCNVFVKCLNGQIEDTPACPFSSLWDDLDKQCSEESTTCPLPESCIASCENLEDGNYPSCRGCHVYASCGGGVIYDGRPCPFGRLWDDNAKECLETSSTCIGNTNTPSPGAGTTVRLVTDAPTHPPVTTIHNCIESCKNVPDGNYHSCLGCHVYASCGNGVFFDGRPCPTGLVWDDNFKLCLGASSTCNVGTISPSPGGGTTSRPYYTRPTTPTHPDYTRPTRPTRPDYTRPTRPTRPDYTRPTRPTHPDYTRPTRPTRPDYTRPTRPTRPDYTRPTRPVHTRPTRPTRPVPTTTARPWTTRSPPTTRRPWTTRPRPSTSRPGTTPSHTTTTVATTTDGQIGPCNCIRHCGGLPNGHYQSCNGCNKYATCHHGEMRDNKRCVSDYSWDDTFKRCRPQSSTCYPGCLGPVVPPVTCHCVDQCTGVPDGQHQSCESCRAYVLCRGGHLYQTLYCPQHFVWDDFLKRCDWVSSTCDPFCFDEDGGGGGGEDMSSEEDEDSGGRTDSDEDSGSSSSSSSSSSSGGKSSKSSKGGKSSKSGGKSSKSGGRSKGGKHSKHSRRRHRTYTRDRMDRMAQAEEETKPDVTTTRDEYLAELDDIVKALKTMRRDTK